VTSSAVAVHLASAAALGYGNKGRMLLQKGVGASSIAKTALTAAAVGATAWSAALGRKLDQGSGAPVESSTEPAPATPPDIERAQRQMRVLQWAVPVLTGAVVVLNAVHGEPGAAGSAAQARGAAGRRPIGRVRIRVREHPYPLTGCPQPIVKPTRPAEAGAIST
jgi:hypothetical protein